MNLGEGDDMEEVGGRGERRENVNIIFVHKILKIINKKSEITA